MTPYQQEQATDKAEKQELLNTSFKHVMHQGEPSMGARGCAYRGNEGRSCAAAPFIVEYDAKMEGYNWASMCSNLRKGKVDEMARKHAQFVTDLQGAHDNAAQHFTHSEGIERTTTYKGAEFLVRYLKRIINVANVHGLTLPSISVK